MTLSLWAPGPAQARDFSIWGRELQLDLTNTFGYRYHLDNDQRPDIPEGEKDERLHHFLNILELSLSHGDLRLGTRLDLNLFADTPFDQHCVGADQPAWCTRDAGQRYVNAFTAEKIYFIAARPEFDLTLGDFYASLGKGLALNVVKIDSLGQDTTIRGGKMTLHHRGVEATFFGGEFNPLSLDQATGWKAPWRSEPVLGGQLYLDLLGAVTAGVHAVYIIRDDPGRAGNASPRSDHDIVWGGGLELPQLLGGRVSLSAEVDLQRSLRSGQIVRGPGGPQDAASGLASYSTATLQLGELGLLAEFKYYDGFQLAAAGGGPYDLLYHTPPTLERISADIKDNTSVAGPRLRLDYNLGKLGPLELLLFINYAYFNNWSSATQVIHSPEGGVELQWQEGLGQAELSAGTRRAHYIEDGSVASEDLHLELELTQSLWSTHSLSLTGQLLLRDSAGLQGLVSWEELGLSLGYKWGSTLALAVIFERQGDPRFVEQPVNFVSGSARYYLTSGSYLSLRGGQSQPGIKCFNGMCRAYPAFSGVEFFFVGRL